MDAVLAAAEAEATEERQALAELGHALLAEGRLVEARTLFEGLAAAEPRDEAAPRLLAVIAARQGRWADVEALATAALGRRPGAAALLLRAEARWRAGRYGEAGSDLEAIARAPSEDDDGEALKRRAAALLARLRRPGR